MKAHSTHPSSPLAETKPPFLVGVDIGTLSTKGVLVDATGVVLARAAADHRMRHPQPGWMEHDAERDWWGGFVRVVRELLAQSGLPPGGIAALCVSGLFPALCVADATGRPLRNAILYADARAASYIEHVATVTATRLKGDEVVPKLVWMREHEPDVARQMQMIFSVPGYVVYRLTGQNCIDPQTAFRMGGLVDESRCRWRGQVCARLGIALDALPSIRSSVQIAGGVRRQAARETGLVEGTSVIVGITDTFATLLGNGIVERGEAMIYYGTTGLLIVCNRDLEEVLTTPSVIDDETPFILAAYLLNFGEVLEWFSNHVAKIQRGPDTNARESYRVLEKSAAQVPPGCEGLLAIPHFAGRVLPQVDPYARGGFFGLRTHHTPFHLWRALLESFGYEIYRSVLHLHTRGVSLSRTVASGGGAQSQLWRQIVSDITGITQERIEKGDAALGAAFLAGYAAGLAKDLQIMRDDWLGVGQVTTPCDDAHARYARLFDLYRDLDATLDVYYRRLVEAS